MKLKILVVDDEDSLREVIRDFFELEGCEVTEASNGRAAFELIEQTRFDCVISDVRMPNGDGIELAQRIKNLATEKPKIIFVTGFADISESQAKAMGVLRVVAKPFRPQDLVEIVTKSFL